MKKISILIFALMITNVGFLSGCIQEDTNQQDNNSDNIENQPPTASCSADITSGKIPLTISFFGSGNDSDGNIVSYLWDFDDGNVSNEQNPMHTFQNSGTYTVILTVTDNDNAIAEDTINIDALITYPPTASASASIGQEARTVTFTGTGTDSDGGIVSYHWDFDDDTTSDEQNPTHKFPYSDSYTVRLTVTDNQDATATDTLRISIEFTGETVQWCEDTYVSSKYFESNYGGLDYLKCGYGYKDTNIVYISFNLPNLGESQISGGNLRLYADYVIETTTIGIFTCFDASWDELDLTWQNKPSYSDTPIDSRRVATDTFYTWNVTSAILNAYETSEQKIAFVLKVTEGNEYVEFDSSEDGVDPWLNINAYKTKIYD